MSAVSTPNDSPISAPIQPLHNPSQAAHVVVPQNTINQAPGMGAKALLAKKMAKSLKPPFVSPTDNMMTPCTQKLSDARKKHFNKGAKPVQLFGQTNDASNSDDEDEDMMDQTSDSKLKEIEQDDENPF